MALFNLPAKILESAASLTEQKIKLSVDLLKIYYGNSQPKNKKEILENFDFFFEEVKKITPPEDTALYLKHHKIICVILLIICLILTSLVVYLIHSYGFIHLVRLVRGT